MEQESQEDKTIYPALDAYMEMLSKLVAVPQLTEVTKDIAIGAVYYKATEIAYKIEQNQEILDSMQEFMSGYKKSLNAAFVKELTSALTAIHASYEELWSLVGYTEEEKAEAFSKFSSFVQER